MDWGLRIRVKAASTLKFQCFAADSGFDIIPPTQARYLVENVKTDSIM